MRHLCRAQCTPRCRQIPSKEIGIKIGRRNLIFQQDNASFHSSKLTKAWFDTSKVRVLSWPSKSPDLNLIENLWGILVREVYRNGRQFSNVQELKDAILASWERVEKVSLKKLLDSMPNRTFEVIANQDGSTEH